MSLKRTVFCCGSLLLVGGLLAGCPSSSTAPATCEDGVCAEGLCVPPPYVPRATCMARCVVRIGSASPCPEGLPCIGPPGRSVCWRGGELPEDAPTLDSRICASGASRPDFEAEPLAYVCEPPCEGDGDCREGEVCLGRLACGISCASPMGAPCAAGSRCVEGYCVNARRFQDLDCDGDGDADCGLGSACDRTDAGLGCVLPLVP